MYLRRGDQAVTADAATPSGDDRAWMDVPSLDPGELERALSPLGWTRDLAALLVEDRGHARVGRHGDVWFLTVYAPSSQDEPRALSVAVAPHLLVTAHPGPDPLLDELANDLPERPDLLATAETLLAELFQRAADGFLGQVDAYEDTFDGLEDSVLDGHDRAHEVFTLRRKLRGLRLNMADLRRTAAQLSRRQTAEGGGDANLFVDVYESLYHIIDNIDTLRDSLTGLVDLQLNQRSMRLNEIMKFLTIFSTIFLPITFITGFFGMNLHPMPELKFPGSQFLTIGLMSLTVAAMLYIFRRKHWI